ncbi:hypothetical protein D3C81_1390590 [compost metagenome]
MPNLQGESLRDAMELLSVLQIPVTAEGEGYVVSQEVVNENGGRRVILTLEPPDKEEVSTDGGQTEDTGTDGGEGDGTGGNAVQDSP